MRKTLILLTQAVILLGKVNAQQIDSLQYLNPVEVKSTRNNSKAPFASDNLLKKEIHEKNLGQDIPYLLQQMPSTIASSDAGAGIGYTALRIRGTDGARINVTLNGVPVNDAESQGTFFVNFGDLASSLNSIQVTRGVGSSTNGVGAFGATMNMSNLDNRDTAGIELRLGAGSFNTYRGTLLFSTGWLKNKVALDGRISSINSNGFVDRSQSRLAALQLNATYKLSAHTQLKGLLMMGKEKTGQAWNGVPEEKLMGDAATLNEFYNNNVGVLFNTAQDSVNLFHSDPRRYNYFTYANQTDNYRQNYYQLHFNHQFSQEWLLHASGFLTRGKGYYEEYKFQEKYKSYGMPPFITPANDTHTHTNLIRQLWLDNYFYGSVLSLMYQQGNTQITFGGSYTQYDGKHYGKVIWTEDGWKENYTWYDLPAHKTNSSAFIKWEQQLGKWNLYADAQVRSVQYAINGFRKNPNIHPQVNYLFFNPKIGLAYQDNKAQVSSKYYASIAKASKEPNRDDFEASVIELPKPEHLWDVEAGAVWQKNRKWKAAVNLFWMQYKDQLILTGKVNDVGAYTRVNVPHSYRRGIEIMADAQIAKGLHWYGNLTLSQNKIEQFAEFIDDYDNGGQQEIIHHNKSIALSPACIAAWGLQWLPFNQQRAHFFVQNKSISRQYLDNTENIKRSISPYYLVDAGVQIKVLPRLKHMISLQLQCNNVFNKKYEASGYTFSYVYNEQTTTSNYYFPQAGRNWLVNIIYQFH